MHVFQVTEQDKIDEDATCCRVVRLRNVYATSSTRIYVSSDTARFPMADSA